MPPATVAGMVADAIREDRFYVLTHPETITPLVRARLEAILAGGRPGGRRPRHRLAEPAAVAAGLTAHRGGYR
jgi:hypothetical protein